MREVVMNEPAVEWLGANKSGKDGHRRKRLSKGGDGTPYVSINNDPDGYENSAHFHTRSQFQVVLEGQVTFPAEDSLGPVSVHYTDAGSPYGPFVVDQSCKMAILRRGKADLIRMSDREGRKRRNPDGRELYGRTRQLSGRTEAGPEGAREEQVLFAGEDGTRATARSYSAGETIDTPADAGAGLFQLMIGGTVLVNGEELAGHSMRYLDGSGESGPMVAGHQGARVLQLQFGALGDLDE